eukprot:bmy_02686T0
MADDVPCHFVSAVIAGFCTTVLSSPVDVVKTRSVNCLPGRTHTNLYLPSCDWDPGTSSCVCFEQLKRELMKSRQTTDCAT